MTAFPFPPNHKIRQVERWYPDGTFETASPWLRLAAVLIESMIFGLSFALAYYPLIIAIVLSMGDTRYLTRDAQADVFLVAIKRSLLFAIPGMLAVLAYFCWWVLSLMRGQTPGKRLLGLYVLHDNGGTASVGRMLLRELGARWLLAILTAVAAVLVGAIAGAVLQISMPPKDAFVGGLLVGYVVWALLGLLGPLWILISPDRQALWDKMSGTYVAHARAGVRPPTVAERWTRSVNTVAASNALPVESDESTEPAT